MLANANKTNTKFGQVLEYVLSLEQSDLIADLKEQFLVFKDTESGANVVRIKQTEGQLYYNVFIEGDWDETDVPLTLSDPDQVRNLPQEPARINNNTYARVDSDFKLYDQGTQYIRLANNPPTLYVSSNINFRLEGAGAPIATIQSTGLNMNSNRITSLANPTTAADGVNRQFLDKYDFPIGGLLQYWGYSAPDSSWLVCNGTTFNQALYPDLYTLLGNSNVLPNLQGAFLRGASDGVNSTLDSTNPRAVRTYQADDNKSHNHGVTYVDSYFSENLGINQGFAGATDIDYDNHPLTTTRSVTSDASGGPQAQPRNYAVLMLIKAKRSRDI